MSNRLHGLARQLREMRAGARSTPGRLRVYGGAIAVTALLFCLTVLGAVRAQRQGIQAIGKDAAPSIIEAERIKADLTDMHSQAANMLLARPHNNNAAATVYYRKRAELTKGLLTAAGNVTYGDRERIPLQTLLDGLAQYESLVAMAFLFHEQGNPLAITQFRMADDVLHSTLLPAASMLDAVNHYELNQEYQAQQASSWLWRTGVGLTGLLLVIVLLALQRFLYRRMRRVFNPALLAATLVTVAFLIYAISILTTGASTLRLAKQDAFESVHALWQARADAYDGNAEESLWLLEQGDAKRTKEKAFAMYHQKAFDELAGRLARINGNAPTPEQVKSLGRTVPPKEDTGFLFDELRNITFAGEQDQALAALARYAEYLAIDREIRNVEAKGDHARAVALCLGERPGESNWAFDQFDQALDATLKINQNEFDRAIQRGFAQLAGFEVSAPLAALAIIGLAFVGLRPRLREYAV